MVDNKRYKTFFYDDDDDDEADSEVLVIPASLVKNLGWTDFGELNVSIETQHDKLGIFITKPEFRCPRCTHLLEPAPDLKPSGMKCSNPSCEYSKRVYNKVTRDKLKNPK